VRIAIIETGAFGGLLHYAVQLGDGLAARGHQVDLITPEENELVGHSGPARMRPVLTPPSRPDHELPRGPVRRFLKRAGVALRLISSWRRVVSESRRGDYDVVILNCDIELSVPALGALVLASLPDRPRMVEIVHNAQMVDRSGRAAGPLASAPVLTRLLRAVHARYDLALVHGSRSEAAFIETWPHKRVATIPHGDERIFSEDPPPPSPEERLLFFGAWNRVKGIPLLMDAFDLLIERRPAARLTMAGMPHAHEVDVEAIRAWARDRGGAVELIDRYIPMEEVRAIFAPARVVVTPYVIGYQSGVVHLAMTMARAVVTTDVGDLSSVVIDEETGIVVPPADPKALAEALERVLADPELAARLGGAGHDLMSGESSWGAVAERAEEALLELWPGDER
jgi:glycosyltransferase involved in cell wall biosynthesis